MNLIFIAITNSNKIGRISGLWSPHDKTSGTNVLLPNPHALLHVCGGKVLVKVHHKLGKLLDVDHILWVLRVWVDNLGAAGHLYSQQKRGTSCTIRATTLPQPSVVLVPQPSVM